jgi:hypothetical protein
MKKFLFLLAALLVSKSVYSQELRVNEVDEFTKSSKKITKTYILAKGHTTIRGYVGHIGQAYAIYTYSSLDLGCGGSNSNYIIFLFEDGTSLKLEKDIAKIDCSTTASSIYIFDPAEFQGKVVTKIRFARSQTYDDCAWSGEFSMQQLIDATK